MTNTAGIGIEGTIRYADSTGPPVGGVIVHLDGPRQLVTRTNEQGHYRFDDLEPGNWRVTPRRTGANRQGAVDSADGVAAVEGAVGTFELSSLQRFACDVTGSGGDIPVSGLDAVRIFQFAGGLATRFPAADRCDSDWGFLPEPGTGAGIAIAPQHSNGSCIPGAILYESLAIHVTTQDFVALIVGDCTGDGNPINGAINDQLRFAAYQSAGNKFYFVLSSRLPTRSPVRVTSVAISDAPVVSINEAPKALSSILEYRDSDQVLTSVSGTIGSLPEPNRIRIGRVAIDPTAPPSIGFVAWEADDHGQLRINDRMITWSGAELHPASSGAPDAGIPAMATANNITRRNGRSTLTLRTMVFPGSSGDVVSSDGPTCANTGAACDPNLPSDRQCFLSQCNHGGRRPQGQNVTLDAAPVDSGLMLNDGFDIDHSSVVIIAADLGNNGDTVHFAASGFRIFKRFNEPTYYISKAIGSNQ